MKSFSFIILIILYLLTYVSYIYADDSGQKNAYELGTIVVTPYKVPVLPQNLNRSVCTIRREEIEKSFSGAIPDLFAHIIGTDIQRRGAFDVQSDLSIRGANFEENLILVDGISFSDPQTGHHDMDIPLTLYDIDRAELVKGHTSNMYGPGGFGGALNIITKKPQGTGLKGRFSAGENRFFGNALSLTFPLASLNNRFSFENKKSGGWRNYTKFDVTTFSYNGLVSSDDTELDFQFGWKDNDFQADSFYSNLFPREEEHTDTTLIKLGASFKPYQFAIEPKLYYRRHADKFMLDCERRGWNENFHTSYVYGSELLLHMDSYFGRYTLGTEIANDKIESTNLGCHSHEREGVLLAISPKLTDKLTSNAGLRYDHFYKWGNVWSPSFDIGYLLSGSFKLRSSVGRSFRTPSFTELYYNAPGNIGNRLLTPEEAWSYEAGVGFKKSGSAIDFDIFRREADNVIDWVRASSNLAWRAQNIGEITTDGLELAVGFAPEELKKTYPLKSIKLSYSYLDSDRHGVEVLQSKYALNFLRHHVAAKIDCALPFGVACVPEISYKDRVNHEGHFLLDISLSKDIICKNSKMRFFVKGSNLLNTFYTEVEDVAPPGRWLIAGTEIEF